MREVVFWSVDCAVIVAVIALTSKNNKKQIKEYKKNNFRVKTKRKQRHLGLQPPPLPIRPTWL